MAKTTNQNITTETRKPNMPNIITSQSYHIVRNVASQGGDSINVIIKENVS